MKCKLCDEEFENEEQDICFECFEGQDEILNQIMNEELDKEIIREKQESYL